MGTSKISIIFSLLKIISLQAKLLGALYGNQPRVNRGSLIINFRSPDPVARGRAPVFSTCRQVPIHVTYSP